MGSKAAIEGFAGGVGSLISLLATYPLKTVYTLRAIRAVEQSNGGRALKRTELHELLSDPAQLLSALCPTVGPLYAGLGPAAVETCLSSAVYFYLYSWLRSAVVAHTRRQPASRSSGGAGTTNRSDDIGVVASLCIAALAGTGNQLMTTPMQVVTTHMQTNTKLKQRLEGQQLPSDHVCTSSSGIARHIYHEDGLPGFWKGLVPSLILVINPAIQYALFEMLTQRALGLKRRRQGNARLAPGETFLLGATAKIGATIVTYPMIVVKSRLQAINSHTSDDNRYDGTANAVKRIFLEEGPGGFFKGMGTKIVQTAFSAGLMFMVKEQVYTTSAAFINSAATAITAAHATSSTPRAVPIMRLVVVR